MCRLGGGTMQIISLECESAIIGEIGIDSIIKGF